MPLQVAHQDAQSFRGAESRDSKRRQRQEGPRPASLPSLGTPAGGLGGGMALAPWHLPCWREHRGWA